MATTIASIRKRVKRTSAQEVEVQEQDQPRNTARRDDSLPMDTCGFCEASLFGAFEGAARDEPQIHMSEDRRRHEEEGTKPPPAFRCRQCGHMIRRIPEDVDARMEAVE